MNKSIILTHYFLSILTTNNDTLNKISNPLYNPLPPPLSTLGKQPSLQAGLLHACFLSPAGTLDCWGMNNFGQAQIPTPSRKYKHKYRVLAYASGAAHNCFVSSFLSIVCWGDNVYKQVKVPKTEGAVLQVWAGAAHNCYMYMTTFIKHLPDQILDDTAYQKYFQQSFHDRSNVRFKCFGGNTYGESDVKYLTDPNSDLPIQISLGGAHSCVITFDSNLICYGSNFFHEIVTPDNLSYNTYRIALGSKHTCAIDNNLKTSCWGNNSSGQCDIPTNGHFLRPLVYNLDTMEHTCVILYNKRLVCNGGNAEGQLDTPKDVQTKGTDQVAVGGVFTCAYRDDHKVRCWGDMSYGTGEGKIEW
eukprot:Mrub_04874.p1 GENE.Mrub_04874~~Mrub_04874.p1  ORF type:complete len:359 (+),score=79.71 Mrub_04874:2-1078(+)